jgi:hypothetical protein
VKSAKIQYFIKTFECNKYLISVNATYCTRMVLPRGSQTVVCDPLGGAVGPVGGEVIIYMRDIL